MAVTFKKGDSVQVVVRDMNDSETVLYREEATVTAVKGSAVFVRVLEKGEEWEFDIREDEVGRKKSGQLYLVRFEEAAKPKLSKQVKSAKKAPDNPPEPIEGTLTRETPDLPHGKMPTSTLPHQFSQDNCKGLRTKLLAAIHPILEAEGLRVIPQQATFSDINYAFQFNIISTRPNDQGMVAAQEGGDWDLMAPYHGIDPEALGKRVETIIHGPGTIVGWKPQAKDFPVVVELLHPLKKTGTRRIRMCAREIARQYPLEKQSKAA